jgi:hypothetical protein
MKVLLSLLLLGLLSLVSAVSVTGKRLLVVLEDVEEKVKYQRFLEDLKGELPLFCDLGSSRGWSGCIVLP